MMDYQIQPNSRRCAITGRELQPGERFFSVLLDEDHRLVRKDFSPEGWKGPPAGAVSFWTGHVQTATDKLKPRFDDDLLEECFQRLDGQTEPGRVNFRYVVALLLMRRRRFRYETSMVQDGVEKMILRCQRTQTKHEVVNPRLNDEEMAQVQDEVFNVLGWK
ncbi:MAG: hypothetical protein HYX68_19375 [Planctomycetes bacterium]|nr:hypothetical protein [Planctomycetota bacterium]